VNSYPLTNAPEQGYKLFVLDQVEAGAEGTIDSIERFANAQGVNITVVVSRQQRDRQ
jgi:hypothetical protein